MRWLLLAVVLIALCVAALTASTPHPGREVLDGYLARPTGPEGVYPRLLPTLRERAWLKHAPGQPDGVAGFSRLPDAAFGAERVIHQRELRPTLALVEGRSWSARTQAWLGQDATQPPVLLARVREGLEAACPTPADARLIIDLLLGQPAADVPALGERLGRGELPERIRIQPFRGTRGLLLRDAGQPPYVETECRYAGCLVRFDGVGWPSQWRVASLVVVGR